VKVIQDKAQCPDAILVEPVGTPIVSGRESGGGSAVAGEFLNREADYIPELRQNATVRCLR